MILTVLSCVTMAILCGVLMRLRGHPVQTPDGIYYGRMGAGLSAPRPYAFRVFARCIRPTFEAWDVVLWASMLTAAGCGGAVLFIGSGNPVVAIASVAVWLTVPSHRRAWLWPVLLDMPMLAAATVVALCALVSPILGVGAALVAAMVHERAPVYGAALALTVGVDWQWCAVIASTAVLWVAIAHTWTHKPTDQDPEWLHRSIMDHVRSHIPFAGNWQSWVLPLGVASLSLVWISWEVAAVYAVTFGGLCFATDRNRIIATAALPLAYVVMTHVPEWAVLPLVTINYFLQHDEV